MSFYNAGVPVHGEFTSADASALSESNSRFAIYGGGSTTAVTLAAGDYVTISDLDILCGSSALTVTVYDGANATVDAGETVVIGDYPANGGIARTYRSPHVCQKGTYPKVKTSGAGAVKVVFHGFITGT